MSEAEIGDMVRLLAAHTPLGLLSNMQARTVFEFAQQRGYRISKPAEPMVCGTCQASQEVS
jgi:hypothetical protein